MRVSTSPVSGLVPSMASISSGEGKKRITPSNITCTPLFLNAEPQNIGMIDISIVAFLKASIISSSLIESSSSKNFSNNSSSYSATASTNSARRWETSSCKSAGISISLKVIPLSSSSQTTALLAIKSTTPLKSASSPIGTCKGTGLPPNISLTCVHTLKKSAPWRSILFTNPILGTL